MAATASPHPSQAVALLGKFGHQVAPFDRLTALGPFRRFTAARLRCLSFRGDRTVPPRIAFLPAGCKRAVRPRSSFDIMTKDVSALEHPQVLLPNGRAHAPWGRRTR